MIAPHIASWALAKRNSNEGVAATAVTSITPVKKQRKQRERVLKAKGGGGYMPPPQPTAQEQAAARDWEAQKEFEREQKRQDAIDEKARIEKEADDAAWRTNKGSAYQGALSSAKSRLGALGIQAGDQYGLWSDVMGRYDTANNALAQGADYSAAFSPNVYEEAIGSARTGQRNKYSQAFGSQIDPYFGETQFGSTADDAILSSILDTQYGDALADLQSARDRGQATSSVYDRAMRDLDTGRATANTELQGMGRGVLEDIIGDINTRRQGSLDSAAAWDFGGTYDPTQEANRIRSYADERRAQLEGDIRGAVGGKEFFDINSLLGKAKARVGTSTAPGSDSGSSALLDTFANEATKNTANIKANEGIF